MFNFICAIYFYKFSSSFTSNETKTMLIDMDADDVLDSIRKRVWHHTISENNTIPSRAAIHLRAKRFKFILNSVANATVNIHEDLDVEEHGWRVIPSTNLSSSPPIAPVWDSEESTSGINSIRKIMLQKCKCKKSKYLTS